MGVWTYAYNGYGDLTKQTDAKSQVSTMKYDRLGRLVERTEKEGKSRWVYGNSKSSAGSRSQLLQESAPGFGKKFSYDKLGRPIAITTSIAGQGDFTVKTSYDTNGRVSRTTYPGSSGFYTRNAYNRNGYLTLVDGLRRHAEAHDYDKLKPLITKARAVSSEYLAKGRQLRDLGKYYQQKIRY